MRQIKPQEGIITKAKRDGIYTFQASTDKTDAYGDIVVQKGIDLSRFRQNPIILYQHNSNDPIGKAVDIRVESRGLVADVELAPKGISEKIDTIRGLVEAGILKAVSIGFTAKEADPIRDEDENFTGWKFVKSLLHEISIVSIPANDEALAIARSFNLPNEQMKEIFTQRVVSDSMKRNRNHIDLLKIKNGDFSYVDQRTDRRRT